MKIESSTRMRSFLESMVKEGEMEITEIGWTIQVKRHGYKPNKWYGFGLSTWPLEALYYG
jgi:hypothetical protein